MEMQQMALDLHVIHKLSVGRFAYDFRQISTDHDITNVNRRNFTSSAPHSPLRHLMYAQNRIVQ